MLEQLSDDLSLILGGLEQEARRRDVDGKLRGEHAERLRTLETLRQQEHLLIHHSRIAAMGEMIRTIAHQWRQPLNRLGLTIQQLPLFYDMGDFNRDFLGDNVAKSMEIIRYLSRTIDDFKNYFQPDTEKATFKVHDEVQRTLQLIEGGFAQQCIAIEVKLRGQPALHGYRNEFSQVLLNILLNARDALVERKIRRPWVRIASSGSGSRATVKITDNAGGIAPEIMGRIFAPYFTTKGAQAGTGVGLFMSKTSIERNMGGRLTVRNTSDGAEFRIEVGT
ncbi:sensor histidine kinase [Geomesophilobacter sediminis]|uniref:histidine kinase n=1 Tax=Geomesophilobacter sediminis TaxID=2798584 RepID=A0A8J7JGV9_9BACT|nr:ATP-binding protein [Geomesophilobacter sediminis]MBJ6726219.1 hypothetical protein [Geomesophilobacter sediminis]